MDKQVLDLRGEELRFTSSHQDGDETIVQLVFDSKVIVLNEDQASRLGL